MQAACMYLYCTGVICPRCLLPVMTTQDSKGSLAEVAKVFLKLGITGFGGPAVHIAMMEEEVVRKRKWITHERFLDLVGATNLIPGPNSTEMTMHCGHERAGWKGLVVAGLCFILPAVIITGLIAAAYQRYGTLPQVRPFVYGIQPAIIAVVVSLMVSLGRKALKTVQLGIIGAIAVVLSVAGVNELYVLFGGGMAGVLLHKAGRRDARALLPLMLPAGAMSGSLFNWKMFWIFLKVGAVLYGSGYVLFAFLDTELVSTGMLSKQALTDAIAVGQFTPGPVFSSATFIGWQIAGLPGAVAATIGIFLPSFLFVAFLNPLVDKLRRSAGAAVFLDTVNVISVAMILAVCVDMARVSVTDWHTVVIAVAGFAVSFWAKKLNSAFVVLGGAVLGWVLSLV